MSSLKLNNDDYGFSLDLNISSLPSPLPSSSSTPLLGHIGNNESRKFKIPFGISNPSVILPNESMVKNNEGNFEDERKNLSIEVDKEENEKFGNTKLSIRGHWRPSEDAKLKKLVDEFGPHNWNNIAEQIHGRSGKSCRLRWCNQLDPRINRAAFSDEEEDKLLHAHTLHGNKWSHISKFFPGRTDNALKNHYHVIMARKQRELLSSISRKRKLTFQIPANNNVASKSAITSPFDESNSTCTNLNLTTRPLLNYHAYGSQMSLLRERKVEAVDYGFAKICSAMRGCSQGHMGKLKSVDQSNHSYSNSEVSVSESVATNMNNGSILGESENVRDKIKVSFIDFLRVGDTYGNFC